MNQTKSRLKIAVFTKNLPEISLYVYIGRSLNHEIPRCTFSVITVDPLNVFSHMSAFWKLEEFLSYMKNVYYALFYSHIVYAIEVWGLACEVYLNKIITHTKTSCTINGL